MTTQEQEKLIWKYFPGGEWELKFPGGDYDPTDIVEMHSAPLQGYILLGKSWDFDFPHLNSLDDKAIKGLLGSQDKAMTAFEGHLVALKQEVLETIKTLGKTIQKPESKAGTEDVTDWYHLPADPNFKDSEDIETFPPSHLVVLVWTPSGPDEGRCTRDYRGGHHWTTPEHVTIAEVWAWAFKPGERKCSV